MPIIDFILHLNLHLAQLISSFGAWSYLILFVILFAETGLVVTPFLPGDSLLFALGALSAGTLGLNPHFLCLLLIIAALLGNITNYALGHFIGPRAFTQQSRWFKQTYLIRTQHFFHRYGGKTIFLARFMPIIRTFAPFIAGIARMPYLRFLIYSATSSVAWVGVLLYTGYWFGNLPFVETHFSSLILGIIIVSLLPALFEMYSLRR